MASSISPACCRTALAVATISSQEIGLRFCGMVEEPPRPGACGSATSATSVCINSMTSVANLLSEPVSSPHQETSSAKPSCATCQGISGSARSSSRASPASTSAPRSPSEASVPTAPPNSTRSTRGRSSAKRSRIRSRGESQTAHL